MRRLGPGHPELRDDPPRLGCMLIVENSSVLYMDIRRSAPRYRTLISIGLYSITGVAEMTISLGMCIFRTVSRSLVCTV